MRCLRIQILHHLPLERFASALFFRFQIDFMIAPQLYGLDYASGEILCWAAHVADWLLIFTFDYELRFSPSFKFFNTDALTYLVRTVRRLYVTLMRDVFRHWHLTIGSFTFKRLRFISISAEFHRFDYFLYICTFSMLRFDCLSFEFMAHVNGRLDCCEILRYITFSSYAELGSPLRGRDDLRFRIMCRRAEYRLAFAHAASGRQMHWQAASHADSYSQLASGHQARCEE